MNKNPAKQPRKITGRYLENAALYYLQRYATSADNLRRVLTRKIKRSCTFHGDNPEDFTPLVEQLIERYIRSGLLNDKGFAEARVAALRRQGRSAQAIIAKLQAKGLSKSDIEQALAADDSEKEDGAEMQAALALARKKKLGVFNPTPPTDPKAKQKELAAMARAGFSFDVAKRAMEYDGEETD
jgi:regulatory protein